MKVTIKIPKSEKDKWVVSFGKGIRKRNSASVILNAIERYLQPHAKKEKIAIKVLEYNGTIWENVNESLASQDANYLLYVTSCFLEDYLSHEVLRRVEKLYLVRI